MSSRPRVVLFSPSRSKGMSHYARALGEALAAGADVQVLDRAENPSLKAMRRDLSHAVRSGALALNTSPHWSVPFLVRTRGIRGGHIFHDPILHGGNPLTRWLHLLYYRLLTRRLGVVVVHANAFKDSPERLKLRPQEIVVVPHGLVPDALDNGTEYDPGGPLVLLGRLLPYKGFSVLVDALLDLSRRGHRPRVIVAGEHVTPDHATPELPNLEVRPGLVSDSEFSNLVARCSAVLLPYLVASQSGVLATAFRMGRPVIASALGSFPEYVHDEMNGLLVTPGDSSALASAIERLIEDHALAMRMAAGARGSWERELSPQRAGERILEALVAAR